MRWSGKILTVSVSLLKRRKQPVEVARVVLTVEASGTGDCVLIILGTTNETVISYREVGSPHYTAG